MKLSKLGCCVVLTVSISVGTAGCGIFDLMNAAIAAAKLFSGAANEVTPSEWELLSRTAADMAGDSNLALSSTEAAAVSQFLGDNSITSFDTIDANPGDLQGLADLASAFQVRADAIAGAGTYDLTDPEDAEDFFEAYGQQIAEGLAETLQSLGVEIPGGGG